MPYSLDLESISIAAYRELLRARVLTPGRRVLHENLDARMEAIEQTGIHNLAELQKAISTSVRIKAYAVESGLSIEYLTILRREVGSMVPKSAPLSAFPGIDQGALDRLGEAGIKASGAYYELWSLDTGQRMIQSLGIDAATATKLGCLCDLIRINGVGPLAAKAFMEAGFRCVADVADACAEEMLARVSAANAAGQYYRASLGARDMQFCIDYARQLCARAQSS